MTEIAILTPDPHDPSYASQWPGVLERLSDSLAAAGVTVRPTPWTGHVDSAEALMAYRLVLPLIVWGYHRDHPRWLTACETWAAAGAPLANPPEVLRWNSDKSYLARLAECGVATPPTMWRDRVTGADVEAAFAAFETDQLVVKPRVSGGAWKTLRLSRGEALTEAPDGPGLIQPYLSTIETAGETSLLFFGGRFSHAVNKRPAAGDFRIQVQFGGLYQQVEPPAEAMALARQTLAAIDEPLLYARIDMAPDIDGRWLLMEAELIEPDLYFDTAPAGGSAFAQAVRDRL